MILFILLLITHIHIYALESEKIYKRAVPSLIDQCVRCITSQFDYDAKTVAHLAYTLSTRSLPTAVSAKLEEHCLSIVNSEKVQSSYTCISKPLNEIHALLATSSQELSSIIQRQKEPLQTVYTAHETILLYTSFLDFLHGTNAKPGNTLITLPRKGRVSSYLLVSGEKHTIIQHHSPSCDMHYYPAAKGLIAAELTKNNTRTVLLVHYCSIFNNSGMYGPIYSSVLHLANTNAQTLMATTPDGSYLHMARCYSDGYFCTYTITTQRAKTVYMKEYHRPGIVECILPSLKKPDSAHRIFWCSDRQIPTNTRSNYNRAGSLYAYACSSPPIASIAISSYPDHRNIAHLTIPQARGIPEAVFFDATDNYLRCLMRDKNKIYVHQFDVSGLYNATILPLLASYVTRYKDASTEQPHTNKKKLKATRRTRESSLQPLAHVKTFTQGVYKKIAALISLPLKNKKGD